MGPLSYLERLLSCLLFLLVSCLLDSLVDVPGGSQVVGTTSQKDHKLGICSDRFNSPALSSIDIKPLPVVHHWSIRTKDCTTVKSTGELLCKGNSSCLDLPYQTGYGCQCKLGFRVTLTFRIVKILMNVRKETMIGSYECLCPQGFTGKGTKIDACVRDLRSAS